MFFGLKKKSLNGCLMDTDEHLITENTMLHDADTDAGITELNKPSLRSNNS